MRQEGPRGLSFVVFTSLPFTANIFSTQHSTQSAQLWWCCDLHGTRLHLHLLVQHQHYHDNICFRLQLSPSWQLGASSDMCMVSWLYVGSHQVANTGIGRIYYWKVKISQIYFMLCILQLLQVWWRVHINIYSVIWSSRESVFVYCTLNPFNWRILWILLIKFY